MWGVSAVYRYLEQPLGDLISTPKPNGGVGWEGASGRCPWDLNAANGTDFNNTFPTTTLGYATDMKALNPTGPLPYQFWPAKAQTLATDPAHVETAISGTTNSLIVANPTPVWATSPQQWQGGYGVYKTSNVQHDAGISTKIESNTSTSLSPHVDTIFNREIPWAAGDTFQIYRPLVVLDQSGRGPGDFLTGNLAGQNYQLNGQRSWPHEPLEPCYAWGNQQLNATGGVIGSINFVGQVVYPFIHEDRDYYNQKAATGSPPNDIQQNGVGVGPRAALPAPIPGGAGSLKGRVGLI